MKWHAIGSGIVLDVFEETTGFALILEYSLSRQNRFFMGGEESESIICSYYYWFFDIFCFGLLTSRRTGLDIILDFR